MTLLERLGFKRKKKEPAQNGTQDMDEVVFRCTFSSAGGMLGGHVYYCLEQDRSGARKLTYSVQETHDDEEVSGELEPSEDLVNELLYIYERAEVKKYGKLKKSDIMVLDAPSESVSFLVEGKETTIRDSDEIPKPGQGIIGNIFVTFRNYVFK